MKCDSCKKEFKRLSMLWNVGGFCEKCFPAAAKKRLDHIEALKAEPLDQMPDKLTTADFEQWADKLAVQFIEKIPNHQRAKLKKNNPIMLIPEQMALHLKELILKHVHPAYISEVRTRGHARMFYGGEYCFRQPVPKSVIIEATTKAGILKGE